MVRPALARLATIVLVLLLGACARQADDTIVFALATAPSVLDPRLASDAASERTNALLYDRLVRLDEHGTAQPAMADWQALAPNRYRVTLRPQRAPFWNGRLPAAGDVAATYRSVLDPQRGSPHGGALAHIARIEVIDRERLDFHLRRADADFAARLTLGIVPAERSDDDRLVREPLGSGPFVFAGWRDDGGLLLQRRRDGQRFALVPVADPTMRALKLLRGETQLLQNDLPAELYRHLDGIDGVDLAQQPGTTFAYLGFNLDDPWLSRREIREAIAHAIDREAIIRHLFHGRAEPAESVLRPSHWAGTSDLAAYRYDPETARRLLAQFGFGPDRPLQLSYKTSTDPFRVRIAHVFQDQLARVGIDLRISSYDWGTFFGDIKAGRFQLYSLAWVGVNTPDILRYAFHSESLPPGGANRGRYRSAEVDKLLGRAEQADADQASGIYRAVQRIVHHDLVYVPLWYEANVVASRDVDGYRPGHDGNYLALNTARRRNE